MSLRTLGVDQDHPDGIPSPRFGDSVFRLVPRLNYRLKREVHALRSCGATATVTGVAHTHTHTAACACACVFSLSLQFLCLGAHHVDNVSTCAQVNQIVKAIRQSDLPDATKAELNLDLARKRAASEAAQNKDMLLKIIDSWEVPEPIR